MYAVVGTLLIALAALILARMILTSRKPDAPAWTKLALAHEVVAVGTLSLGAFGLGFVLQTIVLLKQQPPTALQLVLIGSIIVVFAILWRRLRVRSTLAEYTRQTERAAQPSAPASPPVFASNVAVKPEDPSSPTRPRTPDIPKKAA